jgi:tetratricopeptide (TPR) repeat protein
MRKIVRSFSVLIFAVHSFYLEAVPLSSDKTSEFPKGSLEEALFEDASDGRLDRVSLEQAALIASGISQRDLIKYIQKIDSIYNHIALRWPMKKLSPIQRGQVILHFLHQNVLKNYRPTATEIQKALDKGDYNCVSSTLLFNILCARFHVQTIGIEVPTHVYSAILNPRSKNGIKEVQTTIPQGFLVSKQAALKINEFISHPTIQTWKGKRRITQVPLVAVIYFNRGISWILKGDYAQALPFYRKVYRLDSEFPSLTPLISELYTSLGNKFFESQDYASAIRMYREGLSFLGRSSVKLLSENLAAALINQTNVLMNQKRWNEAEILIKQAQDVGPFKETILYNRRAMYYAWGQDYIDQKKWHDALALYRKARKEFPHEKGFHQNLSWTYAKIGEELFKTHQLKKAKIWYAMAYRETGEQDFKKIRQWLEKA